MSARDEQPATLPPPAGEDDAYSAATKVGAMPADVMAKLRAEGLLPEESDEERDRPAAPRPSATLSARPYTHPAPDGIVPLLYSTFPPAPPSAAPASSAAAAPLPQTQLATPLVEITPQEAQQAQTSLAASSHLDPGAMVETPIAFASPPTTVETALNTQPPAMRTAEVMGTDDELRQEIRAFGGGGSKTRRLALLVGGVLLLVVLAFTMALVSQRR